MPKPETRVAGGAIALRAADQPRLFAGYAVRFNSETRIGDWFIESFAPGVFAEAIGAGADIRALFDHNSGNVLGRTTAGTLRLAEDATGLAVEIDAPDTQLGRDLAYSIGRGDISQMSFAFRATDERWTEPADANGLARRLVLKAELTEVSIVTFPAFEDTSIALRSLEAARSENPLLRAAALGQTETLRRRIAIAEASFSRSRNPAV